MRIVLSETIQRVTLNPQFDGGKSRSNNMAVSNPYQ